VHAQHPRQQSSAPGSSVQCLPLPPVTQISRRQAIPPDRLLVGPYARLPSNPALSLEASRWVLHPALARAGPPPGPRPTYGGPHPFPPSGLCLPPRFPTPPSPHSPRLRFTPPPARCCGPATPLSGTAPLLPLIRHRAGRPHLVDSRPAPARSTSPSGRRFPCLFSASRPPPPPTFTARGWSIKVLACR